MFGKQALKYLPDVSAFPLLFSNRTTDKYIGKVKVSVSHLCPTLCDPMDYIACQSLCPWNSPGKNTVVVNHSLLQGIFLTQVSCIAGRFFTIWATREAISPVVKKDIMAILGKLWLKGMKLGLITHEITSGSKIKIIWSYEFWFPDTRPVTLSSLAAH